MSTNETLNITVQDVSGQREFDIVDLPTNLFWGDALAHIVSRMELPKNDPESRATIWQGRRDREGIQIHAGEVVGDVLKSGDRVTLYPEVIAG